MPHDHANNLCIYHEADAATVAQAIDGALEAKYEWESMPWNDRAAIFLKAADLVSGKYRYKLIAATILGQGKNVWQAEIDAAAEVGGLRTSSNDSNGLGLAGRFLEIWCKVRPGSLRPTAHKKLCWSVEVGGTNSMI